MHFHAWKTGLKTGQYYFRSRPARDAIKFTVDVEKLLEGADKGNTSQVMEVLNTAKNKKSRSSSNVLRKKSTVVSKESNGVVEQQTKRHAMNTP